MATGNGDREKTIFAKALDRPPHERVDFLRRACAGDQQLEDRIRRLLAAHEQDVDLTGEVAATSNSDIDELRQIGPYRVLQRIGEGGMGVVFLAEQTRPIRRRVALKIIKLGMDTEEVMARFDAERQALALMNHPHIARILDAGATDRGRPYFVMEYVPGIPIVEYCDHRRLDTVERLRLFVQVCHAIQHAHQKGVIHRDLKPSNILVTEDDGRALPKVIDFGVAKATSRPLGMATVHTELGRMIGTPEYMSPEQAVRTPMDVDTRSDVYSLGVVLYELLSGDRPFELSNKTLDEIQREIREVEPGPPSTRATRPGERAAVAARQRGTNPTALARQLRGELDWITLMALHKAPPRRYQTPLALADDIERHVRHEPVRASPPSTTYRLAKFARRHALAVGAASIVMTIVIVLVTFYTVRLANEHERASRAAERALREARTAEQVTEFLVGLFRVADPGESRGSSITARELLDMGAQRITEELDGQPVVQARLLNTIGRVYLNLGLYQDAERLLEEALDLVEHAPGHDQVDVAESLNLVGEAHYARGDYEAAERLLRRALQLRRDLLGEDDPVLGQSLNNVGAVLWAQGDHAAAEPFYREALALRRRLLGEESRGAAESMNNLAVLLHSAGDHAEAEKLYRRTLAIRKRVLGDDHPLTINSMNNLGSLLRTRGDLVASEEFLRDALELRRQVLAEDHPEIAESLEELAMTLQAQSRYDEAEPLLRRALALRAKQLRADHPLVARSLRGLAVLLGKQGDCEAAAPLFREAIDTYLESLDPDHWHVCRARSEYSACLTELGRYDEAEPLLLSALAGLRAGLGDDHEVTRATTARLVDLYERWGKPDEAAKYTEP
ncbi:MAG: tetratricopeptide repeat protein [Planctomycetota bacterium]|jgi:serine/threonine protein kinase/Tfp pilus assembly protein PilF